MAKKKKSKHRLLKFFFLFVIFLGLTALYGTYVGTTGLVVKEYNVKSKKITDNFYGFKIIHISDIHYGRTIHKKELSKIVNTINQYKPDIVVLTGDLIDKDTKMTSTKATEISSILAKIDVNIGKYAITGNHDYNFDEWKNIIDGSGFVNLNDTYETIYDKGTNYILLSGISTLSYGKETINDKLFSTNDFLSKSDKPCYSILLVHEPDFVDDLDIPFDLILAGHSHNGQVRLPFVGALYKPQYANKYYDEHYSLGESDLYISGGIGSSTINFRLFDRPSMNLYRILKK